ncbi:MAG: K(+)-transporting ATPase subunit F [Deltaproteobacteria bacterium]|nr:K(+)-transporting ATPase subunit F [Deltaproteobacteria bacterium]
MREVMNLLDLVLGASLAIGLTAYLIYALIRPERF